MNGVEFNLGEVVEAVVSQGMSLSREQQVSLVIDSSADLSTMYLYGDNLRLQQVLADFLLNTLQFTSPASGSVLLKVIPRKEHIGTAVQIAHLEFR